MSSAAPWAHISVCYCKELYRNGAGTIWKGSLVCFRPKFANYFGHETLMDKYGHVLNWVSDVLQDQKYSFTASLKNVRCSINSYVGVNDCTKLRMMRPGGNNRNQRSFSSSNKKRHCATTDNAISSHRKHISRRFPQTAGHRVQWNFSPPPMLSRDGWVKRLRTNKQSAGSRPTRPNKSETGFPLSLREVHCFHYEHAVL